MKVLHCLAQLPTRTGSGVYYHNLIHQVANQTDWEQAGVYGLNADRTADWLALDQHYPVQFESDALPFPIAGMSDEMPYRHTVYHQMDGSMLMQWKAAFRQRLMQAKSEFSPDIIICHHLWILCRLVLEIFPDTPVIGISHGTDIRQAKHNPQLAKAEVGSLSALHKVLALSQSDLHDLNTIFGIAPERLVVTGGAYDSGVFYPSVDRRSPAKRLIRLIYAGKISASKGVFELAKAYADLREHYPDLTLDLVGRVSPENLGIIRARSQNDPSIRIFDVESQAVLAEHLRRCDLFVFPSYYEGLGLIALEALASGLHLVSNRLPGLMEQLGPELSADSGITWLDLPNLEQLDQIVPSERPDYVSRLSEAMAEQVERLKQNNTDASVRMAQIEQHSWHGLAEKVMQIMQTTLSELTV